MKASELIRQLEALIEARGDLEVQAPCYDGGYTIATEARFSEAPVGTAGAPDGWRVFIIETD